MILNHYTNVYEDAENILFDLNVIEEIYDSVIVWHICTI